MAATGFTPISLYYSSTTGTTPTNTNLVNGELAINIYDGKLFYKDNTGTVQTIATKTAATFTYPGAGIPNSTGSAWGTSYSTSGTGTTVALTGNPTFASETNSGNYTFTGTGNRITGDFSNATIANRVIFQTSTTNGQTQLALIPNGTVSTSSTVSGISVEDNTSISTGNGSTGSFNQIQGTDVRITSGIRGTGTYLPLTFFTGGSERMRIDSSGNVGIGTTSPTTPLYVAGTATFPGTSSTLAQVVTNAAEVTTVSATAATGTINYDISTQSVLYYTTSASANWTVNFRFSSGTSLNTAMSTGQAITVVFLVSQGATAYYNNAVTIDGASVTPKYQGGTAWTSGNASGVDAYSYTIVKTGSATFSVFAAQTQFK